MEREEGGTMVRRNELIAARVRAGLTQDDAARACGISKNSYNRKEIGRSAFTVDEVVKICEAFGISEPEQRAYIFLA